MQLVHRQKKSFVPFFLQQSRSCSEQSDNQFKKDFRLREKAQQLFAGNAAIGTMTFGAACMTNNPYLLLPLVCHVASTVGIARIDECLADTSSESDLISHLAVFTDKRKSIIAKALYAINHANAQIATLESFINDEKKLQAMGIKPELLKEYIAVQDKINIAKYMVEKRLVDHVAPIFDAYNNDKLEECVRDNEEKIRVLNTSWPFKKLSSPWAFLPKQVRIIKENVSHYSDLDPWIIAGNIAMVSLLTVFSAYAFPVATACCVANMEMAFHNKAFFACLRE